MMRKLSLFLLGLLIWGAAYSTPASILQYKVEPTEDQKTEFFRRAREDPELYSYNPLHVGNKWWRSLSSGGYQLIREVVASTEINGNVYYKVIGLLGSGENHWIRNEGDITYAYDEFDLDNNPDTDEIIHENFSSVGSFYVFHFLDDWPYPWICTSDGEHYLSHYYIPTYIRFHEYWAPGWATSHHTRGWARGFGPTYEEWDDQPDNVIASAACEINGIHYGEQVSNADEFIPQSTDIFLTCFPNPFKDTIKITYKIPDRSKYGTLSIYNVKGQLIINTTVNGEGDYEWDCRSNSGKLMPNGVYYCRLITHEKSKLSKLVLIK
jgi:hypothetical protein